MRKGYPKDYYSNPFYDPYGNQDYGGKTDYYRGQTDSSFSKSEMSDFQRRLKEASAQMMAEQREREYVEAMSKAMREDEIKKAASISKIESEFVRLVEGMLEGINAKESSGSISSDEAERLVQMVIARVSGAAVIAGVNPKDDEKECQCISCVAERSYQANQGWDSSSTQCW